MFTNLIWCKVKAWINQFKYVAQRKDTNKLHQINMVQQIHDLYDDQQQPIGTRVLIQLNMI